MSAYLTWPEARDLALGGTPVRRDGWPTGIMLGGPYSGLLFPSWLEHRIGLWIGTDNNHAILRVCDPGIFSLVEFHAQDWTTDPLGTPRDVCQIDPPSQVFMPPGVGLEGVPGTTTIDLNADIGISVPGGVYTIRYFLDGALVGVVEATGPGRYTVTAAFSWSAYASAGRVRAWIDVSSSLPLPVWAGHAEWSMELPSVVAFDAVDLDPHFPNDFVIYPTGWYRGSSAGVDFGPFAGDRWVYSHAADPAWADDDVAINGTVVYGDGTTDYINSGLTTFLLFLPAGRMFNVNVWNNTGWTWGGGRLRLYNRPI